MIRVVAPIAMAKQSEMVRSDFDFIKWSLRGCKNGLIRVICPVSEAGFVGNQVVAGFGLRTGGMKNSAPIIAPTKIGGALSQTKIGGSAKIFTIRMTQLIK